MMKQYLRATFESLHNRNYRLYFTGQSISAMGNWMQKVAQAWLILEMTDSGTILGITAALSQLPTLLFTPWGGLLADRVSKRKIVLWTQSLAAIPALAIGILTAIDWISLWLVLTFVVVLGCIDALDKPARHSFVIEMVGRHHLTNAVTLNNIMNNAGKVVGPAIAGILISTVGLPFTFLVNAGSYVAVLIALLMMRSDQLSPSKSISRGRQQLREGLRYVRQRPGLLGPLAFLTVAGILAYEWTVTIPLLAKETFGGGAGTVGLMFTAMGIGAVVGGLLLAGVLRPAVRYLILTGLLLAAVMVGLSLSPALSIAIVLMPALGMVSVAFRATASTLLQLRADPEMRGRVMALIVVAVSGMTPVGAPFIGWVCEAFGARVALAGAGLATAVAGVVTLAYLRRKETSTRPSSTLVTLAAAEQPEPGR